ncbi:MAG: hypothetical protein ACE5J1_06900 [Nitrospiria bacterium]
MAFVGIQSAYIDYITPERVEKQASQVFYDVQIHHLNWQSLVDIDSEASLSSPI